MRAFAQKSKAARRRVRAILHPRRAAPARPLPPTKGETPGSAAASTSTAIHDLGRTRPASEAIAANAGDPIVGAKGARMPSGQPLDPATRGSMEPRFGNDFGGVRVHSDAAASESAGALGARAFTTGQDIVFGAGEYAPATKVGQRLIAHELAHVVQQRAEPRSAPPIQRMKIGTGNPPAGWVKHKNGRVVPSEDLDRINSAIDMIREVATDPERFPSCHQLFEDECNYGNANSFFDSFDKAVLWKADNPGKHAFTAPSYPTDNIAYTQAGYDAGARSLAGTLVHELLHTCGVRTGDEHYLADVAGLYCIGNVDEFSLSFGAAINAEDVFYVLLSYRRFLAELGNGQIQLTAGVDVDIPGITTLFSDDDAIADAASAMLGLQGRSNLLFGGERFGGLTARLEAGVGVGRFKVRDADPEASRSELGTSFILLSGIGAEFYFDAFESAVPMSLEATYRAVVPVNQRAEVIHALLGTVGFQFDL